MKVKRLCLVGVVSASLLVSIATLVLDVGLRDTPYETKDSVGRTMGFNDPLSREHYGIIIRNFSFSRFRNLSTLMIGCC
jgi:hypothetical protein